MNLDGCLYLHMYLDMDLYLDLGMVKHLDIRVGGVVDMAGDRRTDVGSICKRIV